MVSNAGSALVPPIFKVVPAFTASEPPTTPSCAMEKLVVSSVPPEIVTSFKPARLRPSVTVAAVLATTSESRFCVAALPVKFASVAPLKVTVMPLESNVPLLVKFPTRPSGAMFVTVPVTNR